MKIHIILAHNNYWMNFKNDPYISYILIDDGRCLELYPEQKGIIL